MKTMEANNQQQMKTMEAKNQYLEREV